MKKIQFLTIAVAAITFSACNNSADKNNATDTLSQQTMTTTSKEMKTVIVTEPVKMSFEKKYPKAQNVEWTRFEPEVQPATIEWDLTGWPMPDTLDYVARYTMDAADYWSWYTNEGDWIGTVTTINTSGLPDAVDATIKKEFPGYTISSVDKEMDKDRTAYEVQMDKGEDKMKALIDENGNIIKKKGKEDGVKIKEKNK